jgi:hypothetical protein
LQLRQQGAHAINIEIRPHCREIKKYGFHMAIRYFVSQSTGR